MPYGFAVGIINFSAYLQKDVEMLFFPEMSQT